MPVRVTSTCSLSSLGPWLMGTGANLLNVAGGADSKASSQLLNEKWPCQCSVVPWDMGAPVDATVNKALAERFHISEFPTLKYFKNGEKYAVPVLRTKKKFLEWMQK
ncbi:hypothetical protein H8959_020494 [Pygathrix nigripes]